jgi:hypothetical protein
LIWRNWDEGEREVSPLRRPTRSQEANVRETASAGFGRNDSFKASAVGRSFAEKRERDGADAAGVC